MHVVYIFMGMVMFAFTYKFTTGILWTTSVCMQSIESLKLFIVSWYTDTEPQSIEIACLQSKRKSTGNQCNQDTIKTLVSL